MNKQYWTIVDPTTKTAIPPFDCNPDGEEEGLLVYRSEESAKAACEHQLGLYGIECIPCRLGEENE